jgi:hypothetical protein
LGIASNRMFIIGIAMRAGVINECVNFGGLRHPLRNRITLCRLFTCSHVENGQNAPFRATRQREKQANTNVDWTSQNSSLKRSKVLSATVRTQPVWSND